MGILFPRKYKCIICDCEIDCEGRDIEICEKCYKNLNFMPDKVCLKCGGIVKGESDYCNYCMDIEPSYDKALSVLQLNGDAESIVYNFKYDSKPYLADTMAAMLYQKLASSGIDYDVVIPVPLNINRESKRGFNQSQLLVQSMMKFGVNIDCTSLVRVKDTISQTYLSKSERLNNVKDAFKVVNKSNIKGKNIVIVDDVFTTGATFSSIAKILKDSGSSHVYGLSFGRAVLDK